MLIIHFILISNLAVLKHERLCICPSYTPLENWYGSCHLRKVVEAVQF